MVELQQGWLSPTGEFFECHSYDHYSTARELADNLSLPYIDIKTSRIISEDDRLLNAGWVYIGIASFMCHEWRIGWKLKLSPEQVCFLRHINYAITRAVWDKSFDWEGITAENIISITWDENQGCYVVFWRYDNGY